MAVTKKKMLERVMEAAGASDAAMATLRGKELAEWWGLSVAKGRLAHKSVWQIQTELALLGMGGSAKPALQVTAGAMAAAVRDGGAWKEGWLRFYDEGTAASETQRVEVYRDAAWRRGVRNDYLSCQAWGRTKSGYYLLGELHGKWESPDLRWRVAAFRDEWARGVSGEGGGAGGGERGWRNGGGAGATRGV